jgi:hypothetical protein
MDTVQTKINENTLIIVKRERKKYFNLARPITLEVEYFFYYIYKVAVRLNLNPLMLKENMRK